ncbi:hypothetical protein RvY_02020-1, partial [Ramazzottius varieornatus]
MLGRTFAVCSRIVPRIVISIVVRLCTMHSTMKTTLNILPSPHGPPVASELKPTKSTSHICKYHFSDKTEKSAGSSFARSSFSSSVVSVKLSFLHFCIRIIFRRWR